MERDSVKLKAAYFKKIKNLQELEILLFVKKFLNDLSLFLHGTSDNEMLWTNKNAHLNFHVEMHRSQLSLFTNNTIPFCL